MAAQELDQIVNLCKNRGFIYQSAEIYGGMRSTYDWGPLGVQLLRNVKDAWWTANVQCREDVVGLDAAIISNPKMWEASGHLANFTDPLVDCRTCKGRFREDQFSVDVCPMHDLSKCDHTEARNFNLMFQTSVGPTADSGSVAYLRPETAQGHFVNFKNILQTTRKKPPFGVAQIGKSFRNEITPQNFVFRTYEFEQMELEFFVPPDEAPKWHAYWKERRMQWYVDLGINAEALRLRDHDPDELSHYSAGTSDVEYNFPWGWGELEGIANRTDYDLTQHSKFSGEKLEYFDQATGERYTPYVIEPAAGVTRTAMAFLLDAYDTDEVNGEVRNVLRLHHKIAPVQVAVLPLSKKPELNAPATELLRTLQPLFLTDYDETQAIGKRYRRQDEIGTPYCITFDFESLEDQAVTVRERDSMAQERIAIKDLISYLQGRLA